MELKKERIVCMFLDFWSLNKLTIKDIFLILVIGDLLDELQGAQLFTKLDLCSWYHQIWMKEVNIPKSAFHTHEGYYEILVIPFQLCNDPSTSQSFLSKILKPFLQYFIPVFFDDILIYRKTWATHVQHRCFGSAQFFQDLFIGK